MLAEDDLGRFTEAVLITLASLQDRRGLKIGRLTPDQQIAVLASAITAVNNTRDDLKLFQAISLGPDGVRFGG